MQYHTSQVQTLTQQLILVNNEDKIIGSLDKKTAHTNSYIFGDKGQAHRAFSIFLFNEKNELLLQKRSDIKITFPRYWANTCCSHPLDVEDEKNYYEGIKLAALRRIMFELNVKVDNKNDFKVIHKLLYKAASDQTWGEYELDYILFIRKNLGNINFNKEEVGEVAWVKKDQLLQFLKEKENKQEKTSPWFRKIVDYKLFEWWEMIEKNNIAEIDNEAINKKIPYL